jgi:hydroxymethylpyrimidine pyrophosphatase-like HAD family hydrolase
MTLVIDIDDTLLLYPERDYTLPLKGYADAYANDEEIDLLNYYKSKGHTIILHTGRNWDKYEFTKHQLERFGIQYDELVMGKPQGIYVDIDSIKSLKDLEND